MRRLRTQGFRTTYQWLVAVGIPRLTGRLSLRYSQVTPNLYLGPQYGQKGKLTLEEAGITASMSLRDEYNDLDYGLAFDNYSYLPIVDNTAPTIEQLTEAVDFIRNVIITGGTVYVHCGSGVGRAPSIVAAYLIAQEGMTVDDAITRIHKARPFIRVLPVQVDRLKAYEEHVRELNNLDVVSAIQTQTLSKDDTP